MVSDFRMEVPQDPYFLLGSIIGGSNPSPTLEGDPTVITPVPIVLPNFAGRLTLKTLENYRKEFKSEWTTKKLKSELNKIVVSAMSKADSVDQGDMRKKQFAMFAENVQRFTEQLLPQLVEKRKSLLKEVKGFISALKEEEKKAREVEKAEKAEAVIWKTRMDGTPTLATVNDALFGIAIDDDTEKWRDYLGEKMPQMSLVLLSAADAKLTQLLDSESALLQGSRIRDALPQGAPIKNKNLLQNFKIVVEDFIEKKKKKNAAPSTPSPSPAMPWWGWLILIGSILLAIIVAVGLYFVQKKPKSSSLGGETQPASFERIS